jgi:peptide/nickel transport system permease protein
MMFPTVLGAGVVVFFLMRVIPGDICLVRWVDYGTHLDPALLNFCHNELGLNNPLHVQFFDFLRRIFSFDFGNSLWTGRPVITDLSLRFALSIQVAIMSTAIVVFLGVPLGIVSAVRQNTWIDYAARVFTYVGVAIPSFWLAILVVFALLRVSQVWFGHAWIPPISYVSPFDDPVANMSQLIWPVIVLGYRASALTARMTRSAMLEVLRTDYVRAARAKGLLEKTLINRHAVRNALLPVITVISMEFSFFMGGLVVVEQVFNLNGIGRLLFESVLDADYNMVEALVMISTTVFVCVNFVIDLLYAALDPRIRYG